MPNTVALVSDVTARDGTITQHELRHQVVIFVSGADRRWVPRPGDRRYKRLEREALDFLLEGVWILGEAAERGISVTPQRVSRTLALIKKESFESEAEYREFLKESHYTRRDVRERVEIQLLSSALQRWLQRRIDASNRAEAQRGFEEFVAEFADKWRARTVCAPTYVTQRCSNGPLPVRHIRRASVDGR